MINKSLDYWFERDEQLSLVNHEQGFVSFQI